MTPARNWRARRALARASCETMGGSRELQMTQRRDRPGETNAGVDAWPCMWLCTWLSRTLVLAKLSGDRLRTRAYGVGLLLQSTYGQSEEGLMEGGYILRTGRRVRGKHSPGVGERGGGENCWSNGALQPLAVVFEEVKSALGAGGGGATPTAHLSKASMLLSEKDPSAGAGALSRDDPSDIVWMSLLGQESSRMSKGPR